MKILLAGTSTEKFSGASKCLIELANSLRKKGNMVTVALPKANGDLEHVLTDLKISVIIIREYQCWYKEQTYSGINITYIVKRMMNEINIRKCRKILRLEEYDIVHVNALTSYVVGKAAILENIPVIWHIREFMEEDLGISFVNRKWSLGILNQASKFIAISRPIYDKWAKYLNVPIEVIYDGVPIENYYVKEKEKHDYVSVLLYGRVVKGKGQLFYIKAAEKALKVLNIRCKFFFAGKIEDKNYFEDCMQSISSSNCAEDIKYIGEINNIKDLLKRTDIVCVCSNKEGFGRVTVEAMLGKCLVIGAASGATTELIEDNKNGILYMPNDIEDFTKKIVTCVGHIEAYEEMIKKGQSYALKNFTSEINADKIENIYKKMVKRK